MDPLEVTIREKNIKRVEILTVAKVASTAFLTALNPIYPTHHGHSTQRLERVFKEESNTLIVVGIRNPLERNISYMFQTFGDLFYNDVKTSKNEYRGEYCCLETYGVFLELPTKDIISRFLGWDYHVTFNDWFEDFFRIFSGVEIQFDKSKGFGFTELPRGNLLLLYTMESLSQNQEMFSKFLGVESLSRSNDSNEKDYRKRYKDVRSEIRFPQPYKETLLHTSTMRFFYTEEQIDAFWNMFPTA